METRLASVSDLPAIVALHNHYVLHSLATFDEVPSTVEQRMSWFETFAQRGPHRLVVAVEDDVVGYACSTPYRAHPSFAKTVEFSVYISPTHGGAGIGTTLYARLLDELAAEDVHRAVVGIALPNEPSVRLHHRFGFESVGVFDQYATKWGQFISSVWMQRRFETGGQHEG